jgi:hypothetical protein
VSTRLQPSGWRGLSPIRLLASVTWGKILSAIVQILLVLGGLQPVAALATTASLSVTGPKSGSTYYVGDSFTVTVRGAANSAVTVVQNGTLYGPLGTTNASGVWSTSGTWASSDVGSYTQSWRVAGVAASTLSFTLAAIPNYTIGGSCGVSGATVALGGSTSATITAGSGGSYSFTVPAFGNYTVTPSKAYYTFSPSSASFNNLTRRSRNQRGAGMMREWGSSY